MSFYGQTIQEFTKLFSKLNVQQQDSSEDPVAPESNVGITYEAGTMWDTLNINPSNRWIQFRGNGNTDTKYLSVGHGTPGEKADDSFIVSATVPEVGEPAAAVEFNQLKNGDYLTLTTEFDRAGHLNSENKSYYRLPVATINIGTTIVEGETTPIDVIPESESDKLLFRGDNHWLTLTKNNDILEFKHTIKTKEQLTPVLEAKQIDPENDPEGTWYWAMSYNETDWEFVKNADNENIIAKDGDGNLTPEPWAHITLQYENFPTFTFGPLRKEDQTPTFEDLKELLGDKDPDSYTKIEDFILSMADNEQTKEQIVYVLNEGDIVKSYDAVKDAQGHIISVQETYFKLPMSPGGTDFSQHTHDIALINERLAEQYTTIVDAGGNETTVQRFPDYETNMDLLQIHNTWLTNKLTDSDDYVWSPTCLYDLTGSLREIYTKKETVQIDDVEIEVLVNREKTLASAIGAMDADNNSIRAAMMSLIGKDTNTAETFYSISDVIQELSEQYLDNKQQIESKFATQNLVNQAISQNLELCHQSIITLANILTLIELPDDELYNDLHAIINEHNEKLGGK